MDKLTNRACARYLRQVRRLLPCARKEKDRITATLYESLEGFSAEKPEAREADVLERFGTPETVAASCLENMETKGVLRRMQLRRRIVMAVTTVALAMLVFWGCFQFIVHRELQESVLSGYSVISEVEVDSRNP